MEACRLAGIRLLGVDLEAFALLRALTPAFATEPGGGAERSALVAVSIGSERSVLGVSDGFSCEYTRVLDWGGNALTDALARGLELEAAEAERIKVELGLQGDRVPEGVGPEQAVQRPRGAQGRPAGLRPRARLLAPVLPGPAGLARDPRAHPRRRHRAARGPGRRAPAARRRARSASATRSPASRSARSSRARSPARRSPSPSASGWRAKLDGPEQGDQALGPLPPEQGACRRGRSPARRSRRRRRSSARASRSRARRRSPRPPRSRRRKQSRSPPSPLPRLRPSRSCGRSTSCPRRASARRAAASPAFLKVVLALVAILVLAGLAGAFMLMDARAQERQATADDLRAQLAELTAQAAPDEEPGRGDADGRGPGPHRRPVGRPRRPSGLGPHPPRVLARPPRRRLADDALVDLRRRRAAPGAVVTDERRAKAPSPSTASPRARRTSRSCSRASRSSPSSRACCSSRAPAAADATAEGGASASGDPQDFSFSIVATIAPEGVPAQ